MFHDTTLARAIKNAEHYKALGEPEVYLRNDPFPWEYVTEIDTGSSHRLEIATSLSVRAAHPCGLTFRWSVDIEPSTANGKGHYEIDVATVRDVMAHVKAKPELREWLINYLRDSASKVRVNAQKYADAARREFDAAASLEQMAAEASL